MDVCTLIYPAVITLQSCFSPVTCTPSPDGTKSLCTGGGSTTCPMPKLRWTCKRPDGTEYSWDGEK